MENLLAFVKSNFLQSDYGIPAVLSRTREETITDNFLLKDISLSIITLYELNEFDLALDLYKKKFLNFKIKTGGYYDQLDISGVPNALSTIKYVANQALAILAEYICNVKINKIAEQYKYIEAVEKLIKISFENDWPNAFNEDYSRIIDNEKRLETISILIISYEGISLNIKDKIQGNEFKRLLVAQLNKFITHVGAIAALYGNSSLNLSLGYRLHASSLAALACIYHYNSGINSSLVKAQKILHHIANFHYHKGNHGYWDRVNYEGKVEIDPISYSLGKLDSPFPIKSLHDQALFAIASKEYLKLDNDPVIREALERTILEIKHYTDLQIGGIFQGQGSWFSTPFDPTVPLARHVMVKNNAKGSFSVGNTCYVPLHEKHADTQFLSLLALNGITGTTVESKVPKNEKSYQYLKSSDKNRNLFPSSYAKLSDGLIDVAKYTLWLGKTRTGFGFGLTPYRSPLGLRSDKSPQLFSALHVISDLTVLDQNIINEDQIILGITTSQNSDGGFSEQSGLLSEVFTTYCAVLTCSILNKTKFNIDICKNFVQSCQHKEGGFGNAPGYPCDIWHTNLATLTLVALNCDVKDEGALLRYIYKCQNADGGYSNQPGLESDVFATFRAVSTLLALGYVPTHTENTIDWLQGLQNTSGGFKYKKDGAESFVGSYHAIAALYILKTYPVKREECIHYISLRQNSDGGFGRRPETPSETTDEGFIAIQALYMLEGKLNPYWATIIT